ncbi:hypothetical protein BMETH_21761941059, partial [methanotrophic bacterial endosymbiont of Bathymodiolus sp.]
SHEGRLGRSQVIRTVIIKINGSRIFTQLSA